MRSPLAVILIILSTFQFTSVSAVVTPGYQCDGVFFSAENLRLTSYQAKKAARSRLSDSEDKYSNQNLERYDGPPFLQPYRLWPISPNTNDYTLASKSPYRIVLGNVLEVFSMVIKSQNGVRECTVVENFDFKRSLSHNVKCESQILQESLLRRAAKEQCQKIGKVPTGKYPARYNGPRYREFEGRHLYIFPLSNTQSKYRLTVPKARFVVMSQGCLVQGVVMKSEKSDYIKCDVLRQKPT